MPNLGSIHTYRSEVDRIIRYGGSTKETAIRREFKEAVGRFKHDIPTIVVTLRGRIVGEGKTNAAFRQRRGAFLGLCRTAINPAVTVDDVDEMLIQHILTEEIFISIFSDTQTLEENSVARELREVEATFFTGATKRDTLAKINPHRAPAIASPTWAQVPAGAR